MSDGTRAARALLRSEMSGTPVETSKLGLPGRREHRLAEGGGSAPSGTSSSLTTLALLGLLDLPEEVE